MNKQNIMQKKYSKTYYTFGRVETLPQLCTGKDGNNYYTVRLTLFGGWSKYALVHKPEQITLHSFVGVRAAPKKDGQTSYVVFPLDGAAKDFISAAACSSSKIEVPSIQPHWDFDDELPF